MGVDILIFRHFVGGKSEAWVRNNTKAKRVSVAGFFGRKTVNGRKLFHGVDLWILDGKVRIPSRFNRPILVSHWDGKVEIVANIKAIKDLTNVMSAEAGMKNPPKPSERLARQFWAVKNGFYFHFEMVGTASRCLRVAKQWGFGTIIHFDGGSSLVAKFSPSYATVYHKPKSQDLPVNSARLQLASN
ncbi:MAG: hypothetical protein HZB70_03385 [Candidatus Berkelbacteria bacterium]|nr:MAG: hypothetical protein HZB70_03385 [Candidatus Berkelbacteria bacterium]QQG51655.1 MAG: hypothetical protein HY845_03805 [Candidatus Berkelbacteria bacterium]